MPKQNLTYVQDYAEALGTGNQAIAYLEMCVDRGIVPDSKMVKKIKDAQGALISEVKPDAPVEDAPAPTTEG